MSKEIKQPEKTGKKWDKTWWGILVALIIWPFLLSSWIWKKSWRVEARLGAIGLLWMFIMMAGKGLPNIWSVLVAVVLLLSFYLTYYFWKQKNSILQKIGTIALVWFVYFLFVHNFKDNWIKPNENQISNAVPTIVLSPTPTVKAEKTVEEIREDISQKVEKIKNEKLSNQLSTDEISPTVSQKTRPQIEVTSVIIKDIGKKYRYFFDIRNKGKYPFAGSISISLYTSSMKLGEQAFNTNELNAGQLEPGLGMSRYIDMNTGTEEVHGEFGISEFSYKVLVEGEELGAGQGNITSKLE